MSTRFPTPETLRQSAGRVCVAVSGDAMVALAQASLPQTHFLEFRLDSVAAPALLLAGIRAFLRDNPTVVAVATCRRKAYGGGFAGSAAEQVAILEEAARGGCALVDLETETAEELGEAALRALRAAGAAVILSWHDFAGTPDLEPELARMEPFGPDFRKIVPTAKSLLDALKLVGLLEKHGGDGRLIAMSMGFRGTLTRVLGPRFGSAFTFASPEGNEGTAPGQMSIATLRDRYRIDAITAKTAIYAVAGQPITGSLSPRMHNAAFREAGLDAVYLPLETDDAATLSEAMQRLHLRGLSVTMPLKETVLRLLGERDRSVEQVGACNTLVRSGSGFRGFNTDVAGIVRPLQRVLPLAGACVLILGAGGAARAAAFGLRDAGANVFLLNRTHERAVELAAEAGVHVLRREDLLQHTFDAIVNSTPFGMRSQTIDAPIAKHEMRAKVFFDLVYNPVETPLLQMARSLGMQVIPGVEMFVEQGVRQFELWTGKEAPRDAMQRAVLKALHA